MAKLNRTIILFLLIASGASVNAQSWKLMRWEFMAGVGTANVFGDISGVSSVNNDNLFGLKDLIINDTRPSMVFAMRYKLTERFSSRLNLMYGYGVSTGAYNKNTETRTDVVSSTHMIEISPQLEYYFLKEGRKYKSAALFNRRGMLNSYATLSSYVFAGVGGLVYSPYIEGAWKNRRNTVNQEIFEESYFTGVFPIGMGAKFILDSRFVLGVELGGRFSVSDKIDGFRFDYEGLVAAPSYKPHNDVYFFSSVNLSYKLRTNRNNLPEIFIKKPHRTGGVPFGIGGSGSRAKSAYDAKQGGSDPKKSWREQRKNKRVKSPRQAKLGDPDPKKSNPRKR